MTAGAWYILAICTVALSMGYKEWIEPLFKAWEEEQAIIAKKELTNNSDDDNI